MDDTEPTAVLVVGGESDLAETYERWLRSEYDVRTAENGAEALAELDESVEVVLVDRAVPGMSAEDILAAIRDRDVDCRVAMVTAVGPDIDVLEMGFDEYVTKPPERDELLETVERLVERASLDDELHGYYALVSRRSALEASRTSEELENSDEYADLVDRIEAEQETVDEDLGDMASDAEFVGAVREIADDDVGETKPDIDETSSGGERR